MIPAASTSARTPTPEAVLELLRWRPAHGVVSLYVDADPADRGGRWRIELRDDLRRATEVAVDGADRNTRLAVAATVGRIVADQLRLWRGTGASRAGGRRHRGCPPP